MSDNKNKEKQKPTKDEQRSKERRALEKDILSPGSKAASTGNQGAGYRGSLQKSPSSQNENKRSGESYGKTKPNKDIYDTTGETRGHDMGGLVKGTRVDGVKEDAAEREPKKARNAPKPK